MKVLIAYDGSECADAALEDLRRAGLPDAAEALIISAADVFVPPPADAEEGETLPRQVTVGVRRAHERAARAVAAARTLAERAAARVRADFAGWVVRAEAYADSPAWAVVKTADEWQPDLIVVGAQGHAALAGRLILGSVSQRILYEARSSVRVARSHDKAAGAPVRIVIGVDGSADSAAASAAVAARTWPDKTEVRVVVALDGALAEDSDDESAGEQERIGQYAEALAGQLRATGLAASVVMTEGHPKDVLVEEAASWAADSIFVGAKGLRGVDRILLGSVSAAVAARAHCSVEVVRPHADAADQGAGISS